jgi:hypothetical protein
MLSFAIALLGLCVADLVLKLGKVSGIRKMLRHVPTVRLLPGTLQVDDIVRIFNGAAVTYIRNVMCIQRSAALTCLLRLHGIRASFTIGCRSMPFLAHAWVEIAGTPLNEQPHLHNLVVVDSF